MYVHAQTGSFIGDTRRYITTMIYSYKKRGDDCRFIHNTEAFYVPRLASTPPTIHDSAVNASYSNVVTALQHCGRVNRPCADGLRAR